MRKTMALIMMTILTLTSIHGCDKPTEKQPDGINEEYVFFMKTDTLLLRDPHIYVDRDQGLYFLTGANHGSVFSSDSMGLYYYVSENLKYWAGPFELMSNDDMCPKTSALWAPEIHKIDNSFYMFVTVQSDKATANETNPSYPRRTDIFKSTTGLYQGPYAFHGHATLPAPEFCIDATYYYEAGVRWSVYCREWVSPTLQDSDGEIRAVQLNNDMTDIVPSTDRLLFKASQRLPSSAGINVTDGAYLYRGRFGELFLLWTSFTGDDYTLFYARSDNGQMDGNWVQGDYPLYSHNGGHGMTFFDLEGKLRIAFHGPNINHSERILIYGLDDTVMNTLKIVEQEKGDLS